MLSAASLRRRHLDLWLDLKRHSRDASVPVPGTPPSPRRSSYVWAAWAGAGASSLLLSYCARPCSAPPLQEVGVAAPGCPPREVPNFFFFFEEKSIKPIHLALWVSETPKPIMVPELLSPAVPLWGSFGCLGCSPRSPNPVWLQGPVGTVGPEGLSHPMWLWDSGRRRAWRGTAASFAPFCN